MCFRPDAGVLRRWFGSARAQSLMNKNPSSILRRLAMPCALDVPPDRRCAPQRPSGGAVKLFVARLAAVAVLVWLQAATAGRSPACPAWARRLPGTISSTWPRSIQASRPFWSAIILMGPSGPTPSTDSRARRHTPGRHRVGCFAASTRHNGWESTARTRMWPTSTRDSRSPVRPASYRVPWIYDDEAVGVLRAFTNLKCPGRRPTLMGSRRRRRRAVCP